MERCRLLEGVGWVEGGATRRRFPGYNPDMGILRRPARAVLAFALSAVVVGSACTQLDVRAALDVTEITTGWLDVGLDNLGRNKLVPAISFRVENVSEDTTGMLQLNAVFRRCLVLYQGQPAPEEPVSPADQETGTCLAEDQVWGDALIQAAGRRGLDPGADAGPFTMESTLGYTGEQSLAEMLQHRDFVDAKIELFVKHRADQWAKLGEFPIERRLLIQ